MNKPCLTLIIAAVVFLNPSGKASDFVSFPSGSAAWTIEVSYSSSKGKSTPPPGVVLMRMTKIDVTQNEKFLRSIVTYSDGSILEDWSIKGSDLIMFKDHEGGRPLITPSSGSAPFLPSCFDWIKPACLQEKTPIEYDEKQCFHYKGAMSSSPSTGSLHGLETAQVEAWIDSRTLLPVAIDDGNLLAKFTFLPSPKTPLVIPDDYKQLYEGFAGRTGAHPSR